MRKEKKPRYIKSYQSYADPAHGWLKVQRKELKELGILPLISTCSYQRGEYVYLEEDCDMTLFLETKLKKQNLTKDDLIFHHHTAAYKRSKIRSYYMFALHPNELQGA